MADMIIIPEHTKQDFNTNYDILGRYSILQCIHDNCASKSNLCVHKDDSSHPFYCNEEDATGTHLHTQADECGQQCTEHTSCVGFTVYPGYLCYIYPSEKVCPAGWIATDGTVASNVNDLEVSTKATSLSTKANCYAKRGTTCIK